MREGLPDTCAEILEHNHAVRIASRLKVGERLCRLVAAAGAGDEPVRLEFFPGYSAIGRGQPGPFVAR